METANAVADLVLGGSRTADNLIDMEDSSRFDPGALALLFQGRLGDGLTQAVGPTLSRIQGRSPAVRQEMGRMLTKTGDEGASLGCPRSAQTLIRYCMAGRCRYISLAQRNTEATPLGLQDCPLG